MHATEAMLNQLEALFAADAERTADRIRENASTAIEREVQRARERLREEAAHLAIELAGQRRECAGVGPGQKP